MRKLFKEILLVLAGLILCVLSIAFVGWFTFHYTEFGRFSMASAQKGEFLTYEEAQQMFGKDPMEIFDNHLKLSTFIFLPLVAVVVGVFCGLTMNKLVWVKTLISLAPLHFFNLDHPLTLISYALLALFVGLLCSRFLIGRALSEYFKR